MKLKIFLALFSFFTLLNACTSKSSPPPAAPKPSTTSTNLGNGNKVGEPDIIPDPKFKAIDKEFEDLKKSLSTYKESDDYKNPKDDNDRTFNAMIDGIDELSLEEVKILIASKKFTEFQKKIQNLPSLIETDPVLGTATDIHASASTSGSSLEKGTGAAMIVFSTIGIIGAAGISAAMLISKKEIITGQNKFIKDNKYLAGAAGATVAALMTTSLITGALLVSSDSPSQESINAAKFSIGLGASLTAVVTLVAGATAVKLFTSNAANPPFPDKYTSLNTGYTAIQKSKKYGKPSAIGLTAVFAGITAGLAIWTDSLGLTSPAMSNKEIVVSHTERFFAACQFAEKG